MSENRIASKFNQESKFTKNQKVHIRWMIRRDMPEVLDIENRCFEYPWNEKRFLDNLRKRNCIGMVAETPLVGSANQGSTIVAFMLYNMRKGYLEIPTLAVHPQFWRMGIGRQMIDKLVGKLSSHHRTELILHVRETAINAQFFFRSQGFLACSVEREYFEDTGEDAYEMRYAIG